MRSRFTGVLCLGFYLSVAGSGAYADDGISIEWVASGSKLGKIDRRGASFGICSGIRRNYTLMYESHILQAASPGIPRVILTNADGRSRLRSTGIHRRWGTTGWKAIQFRKESGRLRLLRPKREGGLSTGRNHSR